VLTREEIERIEDVTPIERDKLIVRLLADTGIREDELVKLGVGDIVEVNRGNYLRIQGKGSRERLVPIPRLAPRLRVYARHSRPSDIDSDRLFVGLRRRAHGDFEPLTGRGVRGIIQKLGKQAGIEKRVYPHLLRHSFATWSLQKGMNPVQLMRIMGHSSLTMITNVYAHLSPSDAYDALLRVLSA
jgi:integrase